MSLRFFTAQDLAEYQDAGDPLAALLGDPRAQEMTSERWLAESMPKRMVAWKAYRPLLEIDERLRVLDIGAGFSSLTFMIARRHHYIVCDLALEEYPPGAVWVMPGDWWNRASAPSADLVMAVDLFPNVDQRLDEFLLRYRRHRLRLVLTTYEDRWYRAKREDADEVLTVQAWNWQRTWEVLHERLGVDWVPLPEESIFPNGRHVCLLTT